MNIDYENFILKIIIPIIVITISVISLFISTRNTRRTIRVTKLEEMLEIIFFLQINYRPAFKIVTDIIHFKEEVAKGTVYTNLMDEVRLNSENHKKKYEEHEIFKKLARLTVISNAYLPNKGNVNLKMQIQLLIDLIVDMNNVIGTKGDFLPDYIKNGLPRSGESTKLFESIDKALIKEMGLGYQNMDWKEYRIYRDKFRNSRKL